MITISLTDSDAGRIIGEKPPLRTFENTQVETMDWQLTKGIRIHWTKSLITDDEKWEMIIPL